MNEAKNDLEHGLLHMQQTITRPLRAIESNLIYHHRRKKEERRRENRAEKKKKLIPLKARKKGKETKIEKEIEQNKPKSSNSSQKEYEARNKNTKEIADQAKEKEKEPGNFSQMSYQEQMENLLAKIYVEPEEVGYLEEQFGSDFYLEKRDYLDGFMLVLEPERLDEIVDALHNFGPDLGEKLESYFSQESIAGRRNEGQNIEKENPVLGPPLESVLKSQKDEIEIETSPVPVLDLDPGKKEPDFDKELDFGLDDFF